MQMMIGRQRKHYSIVADMFIHSFLLIYILKSYVALWVRDNESNTPPKTHNLIFLINNSKTKLIKEDLSFIDRLGEFQIESRYPDYQNKLYKICNKEFTEKILKQVKSIGKCLVSSLQ